MREAVVVSAPLGEQCLSPPGPAVDTEPGRDGNAGIPSFPVETAGNGYIITAIQDNTLTEVALAESGFLPRTYLHRLLSHPVRCRPMFHSMASRRPVHCPAPPGCRSTTAHSTRESPKLDYDRVVEVQVTS